MTKLVKETDDKDGTPEVAAAIAAAHRAMTAALVRELAWRGFPDLSPAYAAVLPLVDPAGTRQVELARRAGLTKQAVGQLVQALATRGYLELVPDPDDRRARTVRFTERGLALRQAGFEAKGHLWSVAAGAVGTAAAGRLARDLRAVAAALAEPAGPRRTEAAPR